MGDIQMTESSKIISEIAQPVHITLTKNTKGYQWEISVYGMEENYTLAIIDNANTQLNLKYGAIQA